MGHRESGDDGDQRTDASERNDQAKQKQKMVGAFQNVVEARGHEQACGVVPVGVQPHQSGIALQLVSARNAIRLQVLDRGDFVLRQAVEGGVHRNIGLLRLYGIFE